MTKVADYLGEGWVMSCPACECFHLFFNTRYNFNGDFENPTFDPEMVICTGAGNVCMFSVTNGKIIYSDESSHSLSGQTVDMIDI